MEKFNVSLQTITVLKTRTFSYIVPLIIFHSTSKKLLTLKTSSNGWSYWYVKRDNKMVSIDELRYNYESKYLKHKPKEYTMFQDENNVVCEPTEDFLVYGNNAVQSV
jgi:hypothetical protein